MVFIIYFTSYSLKNSQNLFVKYVSSQNFTFICLNLLPPLGSKFTFKTYNSFWSVHKNVNERMLSIIVIRADTAI